MVNLGEICQPSAVIFLKKLQLEYILQVLLVFSTDQLIKDQIGMKRLKLLVTKREEFGRGSMRRLRCSGMVPAVIYGHSGTTALTVIESELKALLKAKGHSASLVDIAIDGAEVMLSDIADMQRDPVTDKFLHVDFHEVSQTEKMTTAIPLEFCGECVGVKTGGGVLDIARHDVIVRCLPADLPSLIKIDVSAMDIGSIVHLSDLSVPSNVELIGDPQMPVVACKSTSDGTSKFGAAAAESKLGESSDKAETAKKD
jgi:large subunit ribosomal protein L25